MSHGWRGQLSFALLLMCVIVLVTAWAYCNDASGATLVSPDAMRLQLHGVSPVLAFDVTRDTLQLTDAERRRVAELHARVASFDPGRAELVCPDHYVFVRFRHASRHHNQLQMLMNTIMWAERMNRTAVFGWFYVDQKPVIADVLYNFSEVARHYCVVSPETMRSRLARRGSLRQSTASCYDYRNCFTVDTVKKISRGMRILKQREVMTTHGCNYTRGDLQVRALLRGDLRATLFVIDSCVAFLMRRGLADHAAVYSLLRPSTSVEAKVARFISSSFTPPARFFALHKRHREMTCMDELDRELPVFQKEFGATLEAERERQIRAQCNITIPYLAALHASLGLQLFSFPLFVAHDGQDPFTVRLLVSRGARVYDREHYANFKDCARGLCSLAVDYFVMAHGEYFAGNVLSSVSQNVCFARLGRGKACHGTEPDLIRMFSYDAQKPYPFLV